MREIRPGVQILAGSLKSITQKVTITNGRDLGKKLDRGKARKGTTWLRNASKEEFRGQCKRLWQSIKQCRCVFLPKVNVNRSFGKGERELGPQGQSETESKSEMQAKVFVEETNAMSEATGAKTKQGEVERLSSE